MSRHVYPLGYSNQGHLVEQLMADPKVRLMDIRKSPNTKFKGFSKGELQKKYRERYRFAGEYLGNVNHWNGGPIALANPVRGIAGLVQYLREGYDLILVCGCGDYSQCHRRLIVELLCKAIPDVEVVQPEQVAVSGMIKCISVRQPHASWISNPGSFIDAQITPKRIENRDWTTSYRGRILIHASKTFEQDAIPFWASRCPQLGEAVSLDPKDYPLGAIVGEAELVKVISANDPESSDPWFCGPYGFMLAYAQPIDPVPCKGALKIFDVSESVLRLQGLPHVV